MATKEKLKSRKFKSDAFEAIHSSAQALYKVGAIDKTTLPSFDESCLSNPTKLNTTQKISGTQ